MSLSSLHRIGCLGSPTLLSNNCFSVSRIVCPVTAPSAAAPGLKEVVSLLSCSAGHSSVNLTKEFNGPGLFTLSVASGKW